MKRYKRIFCEGKQQAIQLISNKIENYVPFTLDRYTIKYIVDALEKLDPTSPKNKYVEVFAKIFLEQFKSHYFTALAEANNIEIPELINDTIQNITAFFQKEKIIERISSIEKRNLPINLSKIKDKYQLSQLLLDTASTITKSTSKLGIAGLREGKDYIEIPLKEPKDEIQAFIPLNYKASRIIASNSVGRCVGKWCTAYEKTDEYWKDYMEGRGGILVYVVKYVNVHATMQKYAVYFQSDDDYQAFDAVDQNINPKNSLEFPTIKSFVSQNWDKIRKAYNIVRNIPRYGYWMMFGANRGLENKKDRIMSILEDEVLISKIGFAFRNSAQFDEEVNGSFTFAMTIDLHLLEADYDLRTGSEYITIRDEELTKILNIMKYVDNIYVNHELKDQWNKEIVNKLNKNGVKNILDHNVMFV